MREYIFFANTYISAENNVLALSKLYGFKNSNKNSFIYGTKIKVHASKTIFKTIVSFGRMIASIEFVLQMQ